MITKPQLKHLVTPKDFGIPPEYEAAVRAYVSYINSEPDDLEDKCEKFVEGLAGCFYDGISAIKFLLTGIKLELPLKC